MLSRIEIRSFHHHDHDDTMAAMMAENPIDDIDFRTSPIEYRLRILSVRLFRKMKNDQMFL
jgi:hypothetical protein